MNLKKDINTKFITNNTEQTYDLIKKCLLECKSFKFNVAFISFGGYQILAQALETINKNYVKGKILTTSYQYFTDPKVINLIYSNFENFEIKIVDKKTIKNKKVNDSFHPKGYIFEFDDHYKVIIGSVNLTEKALKTNVEWSLLTILKKDEELMQNINEEFDFLWNNTEELKENFIKEYEENYLKIKEKKQLIYSLKLNETKKSIEPNSIQEQALEELTKLRKNNAKRALVIAATGVGKTYLSAFDVKNFNSKKTLFVVHRDEILRKSKESFENVLPNKRTGIFKGQYKETNYDIVFASKQTLENNLNLFNKDEFDYIIIDEAHHAAAEGYRKIMDYFEPNFLLGMTATPDRMDGGNIWEIFEHNIAIDVRLKDAIEKELITTFHYFGISDLSRIDLSDINIENLDKVAKKLMINERVDYIIEKMNLYKYDGEKMHCIAFCANKEHAIYMSNEFNKRGIKSEYLVSGSELKSERRKEIIKKFESDEDELNVIFAVDILNEGVDIPNINMVLFLRPTNSPIIFLQQLGRGLRKNGNKKFLTVLDFIANHNKSYLIPYAFASYNNVVNERYIYDSLKNDFKQYENIHIEFDEISKNKIFKSIENVNFNSEKWIKYEYNEFKRIMNNQPILFMCDYLIEGAPDVIKISKKYKNYLNFLSKIENRKEFFDMLQCEDFRFCINFLTNMLPLPRINEFAIIFHCIKNNLKEINIEKAKEIIDEITPETDLWSVNHSFRYLNNDFFSNKDDNKKIKLFNLKENELFLSENLIDVLKNLKNKEYILDCLEFGIQNFISNFGNIKYSFPFLQIGQRYSMKSAMGINQDIRSIDSLYGQGVFSFYDKDYYLFITLKKEDGIKDSINYQDGIDINSRNTIYWESQNTTKQNSKDGINIIKHKEKQINLHIFIRKYSEINKVTQPFIYLGRADVISYNGEKPIKFKLKLQNRLSDDIYYELISK